MAIIKKEPKNRIMQLDTARDIYGSTLGELRLENYKTMNDVLNSAQKLGINLIPFDIKGFLERHSDIKVEFEVMDDLSGCVYMHNGIFKIAVNAYQNAQRQRFTLAHELAHIINDYNGNCNFKIDDQIMFRDKSNSTIEQNANAFAAELLMPQSEFANAIRNGYSKIDQLATYFNVSPAAARYRASKLGYIGEY